MNAQLTRRQSLLSGEAGATATEYAVMLAFISLVVLTAFASFGELVHGIWEVIADAANPP